MATLGFIGYGIVGQATANGFKEKHRILFHDRFKASDPLEKVVRDSEFIFLCLPTPMTADGSGIDLTIMQEAVDQIAPMIAGSDKIIVVKSTVVPGTTARFAKAYPKAHFAMNPEFLREKTAEWDFLNPDRVIIGAADQSVLKRLEELYRSILPEAPVFLTTPAAAELVKYMSNAFLALKVTFANEFWDLCKTLDTNYDDVKKMVAADKRIGESHLDVTEERGFGGKCLPKDAVALLGLADDLNVDLSLLKTAWKKNLQIRSDRDWEQIDGAVSSNNKDEAPRTRKLRVFS